MEKSFFSGAIWACRYLGERKHGPGWKRPAPLPFPQPVVTRLHPLMRRVRNETIPASDIAHHTCFDFFCPGLGASSAPAADVFTTGSGSTRGAVCTVSRSAPCPSTDRLDVLNRGS